MRSDLIEMGFDQEVVAGLAKYPNAFTDYREMARYQDETWNGGRLDNPGDFVKNAGGFNLLKNAYMAASPLLAADTVKTTTPRPHAAPARRPGDRRRWPHHARPWCAARGHG